MKKAYAYAGSFAALAVVLAITTTHYSTIMQPVMITANKEPEEAAKTSPLTVEQAEKKEKSDQYVARAVIDHSAPGMQGAPAPAQAPVVAAAPPPPAVSAGAVNQAAPGMAADSAMVAKSVARERSAESAARMAAPGMVVSEQALSIVPYPHPVPYYGGDRFEHHATNQIKSVAQEPVSTFSADVDTASYSFVRRLLNQGQLPQPDMVRIEEMVNYFDYDYPLPESKSQPFKPTMTVMPSPWNTSAKLVHIGIKGYEPSEKPRANLVFLIDVSGSMNQPDKLPLVKSSLKMLLDQLRPDDTIGIVTYAGYAGVALSPTPVSNKQTIISVIDQLGAGGGTAGGEGIRSAYNLARQNLKEGGVNRVILASDGDFNVGITDPEQLKQFVSEQREGGVTLSVLGFGQGNVNDALMQKLAQNGNGNAAYIDSLNEARKVLVQQAGSTLHTIAKDVKLQVEWNPATVASYRLIGYESRMLKREDFNNDKVDAGEIGAGHTVTAIYEITPIGAAGSDELRYGQQAAAPAKPSSEFAGEYGFLKIRYKLPSENESKLISAPISSALEVVSLDAASADARFATSVAAFGQLLKGETQASSLGFDGIIKLADAARGKDSFGYRAEFVQLANQAKALRTGMPTPMPMPACAPGQLCD